MARWRFMAVALLALTLVGNSIQTGRTQSELTGGALASKPAAEDRGALASKPAAEDRSCVMYSLTDMGYDADLGKWIAQTIPEMVEPSSWQSQGGAGVLRYYAPKNVLIVKQSKSIQGKVDGFLKDLRASMPRASATKTATKETARTLIVPRESREPELLRTSHPVPEPSSYPVAPPVKAPKHLFHFIIRYEGDGIIDDNVVKFMKTQLQGAKSPVGVGLLSTVPCAPAVPPAVSVAPPPPGYAAPYGAVPNGSNAPSVAPTTTDDSPVPSEAPVQPPDAAPKKKKEKKENQTKTTVTR